MSDVVDEKTLLRCFRDPMKPTSTDGQQALRLLSRCLRPDQVRKIRDQEVDDHCNSSLLHYACRNSWYDVSRELVDKYQCDPHLENRCSFTSLHYACEGGNVGIVKYLIVDRHCDPACRGWEGRTPLHCACGSGKLDIIKFLVEECHCDPKVQDWHGDTPLHYASQRENIDIAKFLIVDHHCDPACRGWEGRTPLHCACGSGKLDIIKFLVEECHCDPKVQDWHGDTPLHYACQRENIDIAKFLIVDCHCDPACHGWEGRTPLHCACGSGKLDIIKFLVEECHCDPKVQDWHGDTPLHYACQRENIDIAKFLIVDRHCDPACRGREGRTPLHCACGSGKLDIIKFLVEECHCDPKVQDWHGDTPLHYASQRENIDIAKFLIVNRHCDPACCGWKRRTPLHYACGSGKLDIVKFLVEECDCDPRVQDKRSGTGITPLHLACQENGTVDIVRYLITDQNCDPACVTWLGVTPLHYACSSGKLDIVKFLVEECHCDLSEHDIQGTPLHSACLKNGNKDIVRFLVVDHHCDPESRGRWGRTPLHFACSSGKLDIVKFLVEDCNCDPSVRDDNDNTPLHRACEGGKIDIVRFLIIDRKCDPAGRGEWGRTPLHYACYSGKLDVVKFLVEECHCDPGVQNDRGNTPLHFACKKRGNIDIVRFLIIDHHCDPACGGWNGRTPLHCACGSGKLDIVKFLVDDCNCNVFQRKDCYGDCPLYTATLCNDVLLFLISHLPPLKLVNSVTKRKPVQLLDIFRKCRTEYPLESAFKIFVLGNHGAGKSTLAKVIENEFTSSYGSFAGQWRNVSESAVVPLTAGIIPVSIESRTLGQIVVYDMAGHYQYYSSHATLLRNLVSSSTSMFLVVVSLNQEKKEIIRQLQYWNSFVDNCCSSACTPRKVAVFSHADKVTVDRMSSERLLMRSFSEVVTLDCRKLASSGLTKIRRIVAGYSATLRQTFRVDFAVQLLYAFVSSRLADRIACTVSELQSLIKQEQGEDSIALKIGGREILPTNAIELSQHLAMLSDKGQFLFLKNSMKIEDSWVVIDKAVLLSEVNGTVFAPNNFKQHHNISNSTGVVPFSKIKQVFPKRDPDMVVAFLQHLEFCQELSEPEVSLISSQHFKCTCGPMERFFFFPALVSEEKLNGAAEAIDTPSYRCEWTLQCSQPHQFLTPQFLHVLLLRLAFSFALAHDDTHEVQVLLVIERRCFVWKNGICWLRNGIKTTVEVIEQNTAVSMTISCHKGREMECVKHRSQAIKCILDAKEDLCPAVTVKESLVHPNCFMSTIGRPPQLFSLSELARTLMENDSELVSHSGEVSVDIEQLLYFEPYACFSMEMLRELLVDKSEDSSDRPVSMVFPYDMNKACQTKVNQLKQVLGINGTNFQTALARASSLQQDQPEYQCKLMFQVWKESTPSPTYGVLRSALDKYSVFNGRNLLELARELCNISLIQSLSKGSRDGQLTLIELVRFRGRERRINIPQEISTKYHQFGILLLEDNGTRVRNMEHKHRGDAEQINMEILEEWVSGRGRQPVSWETLTEVLRDVELSELASDIEAVKLQTNSESNA